jgi:uncharacterized protein with PQ loop repeat
MELGNLVGWVGLGFGVCVPLPQLYQMIRHKAFHVSLWTYILLFIAIACYLWHAIFIRDPVFITAQAVNLLTNGAVLFLLAKNSVY